MKKSFPKSLDSLEGVFDFLQTFIETSEIAEKDAFAVNLVVEELFTNMVKYSGGVDRNVAIRIKRNDHQLILELTDFDSEPFDLADAKPVDVDAPVANRQPGGLGIHIVKTMVDELRYEMDERTLTVSVRKTLES